MSAFVVNLSMSSRSSVQLPSAGERSLMALRNVSIRPMCFIASQTDFRQIFHIHRWYNFHSDKVLGN